MLFGEVVRLRSFDINDADHLVLGDHRDGEFRADSRYGADVFRLLGDVVDQYGFAALRGQPGDTFADLDSHTVRSFRRMTYLETDAKLLRFLIDKENRKDVVINYLAYQFGHAREKCIEIERGVDDIGHFQQKRINGRLDGIFG